MKPILSLLLMAASALAATAQAPTLKAGHNEVEFSGGEQTVSYVYTPDADRMIHFSSLSNLQFMTSDVEPAEKLYTDIFNSEYYFQLQKGVSYTVTMTRGVLTEAPSSFELEEWNSPWPDGGSWDTAINATERMSYVPVTLDMPSYITYTPAEDGVLELFFTVYVNVKSATDPNGTFTAVKTSYVSGSGGYKGLLEVKAGQTYYFTATAYASFMCRFALTHPVTGSSPDYPFELTTDAPATFPKEAGSYYYKITNNGFDGYLLLNGEEPFSGTAKAGTSFTNFQEESTGRIHIRMSVSPYLKDYYLVVTRTEAADADQQFTAEFSATATDLFPGLAIEPGTYTTPDYSGLYYYTFTLPADGSSNIISLKAQGEDPDPTTSASLYFADNQYSTLANGAAIDFEGAAGRAYTVAWRVAAADAPLSFSLAFKAPGQGESPSNPITATIGQNSGQGGSAVYFQYTASADGWMVITPGSADLKMPAVSMLPIPSDPYTQACEVIADADSWRVATTNGRGYLIVFFTSEPVSFSLAQTGSAAGESPSSPLPVVDGIAAIPDSVGTFWYEFTAPRSGKMDVSTDLQFLISENRQEYSYVRIFDPADPDNFLAQLRPDYDTNVFANRVMDTTEGTRYLIKVRTMDASKVRTVSIIVRDPIAGEVPELPIMIPFDGKSGTYTFDRPVNYEADALWYGISLPAGIFNMSGTTAGTYAMDLYAPGNTETPIAECTVLDLDYDEANEMYIYTWGIADLEITEAGVYLMHVTDNAVDFTVDLSVTDNSAISEIAADAPADKCFYNLRGQRIERPTAPGIYISNKAKILVK